MSRFTLIKLLQKVMASVVLLFCLTGWAGEANPELGIEKDPVPWQADLGNGRYQNPILYADYSDPDVVAVGDDFYMTASSFNASPGLPVLHSTDLVNWQLIGYGVEKNQPEPIFAKPQHGNGIWAPCIRYHDGKVWIFYPDPDFGIYMINTSNPHLGWSQPQLILLGKGIIDPTPLWDDDGQAYLLHGWAKSRAGKNNMLTLHEMSPDGLEVEPQGKVIVDGHQLPGYRTLEGPKLYKRNGYYYIFAPAGGVPVGWQAVFRSRNIMGPYEHRTVMEQGETTINGPHQGAWVHTSQGEDWFIHFQSRHAYGRVVHLQPMQWKKGWPIIGLDKDGDGVGNPVREHTKPKTAKVSPLRHLPFRDDFSEPKLALQWQWNANYHSHWYSLTQRPGYLRLYGQPSAQSQTNLWNRPALLLQKLPAPEFIVETTLEFPLNSGPMSAGLTLFGEDYAWIGVVSNPEKGTLTVGHGSCHGARKGCEESFRADAILNQRQVRLRAILTEGGTAVFSYQTETGRYRTIGELFQARPGRWVGAKIGLFNRLESEQAGPQNYVDVESFHFRLPEDLTE